MSSTFTEELAAARTALEAIAGGLDASCSGRDAVRVVEQMGTIHRLADAVTSKVAKRIADTNAHVAHGDRSAAELCARLVGVGSGGAKRTIDDANRLVGLAETRRGRSDPSQVSPPRRLLRGSYAGLVREAMFRALDDAHMTIAHIDAVVIGKARSLRRGHET